MSFPSCRAYLLGLGLASGCVGAKPTEADTGDIAAADTGDITTEGTSLVDGEWVGDATTSDVPGFCDGYRTRPITGDLRIEYSSLTDLRDLACVTSIGGSLDLDENGSLTSLSGLEDLSSIGENLILTQNGVTSLSGLDNLSSV